MVNNRNKRVSITISKGLYDEICEIIKGRKLTISKFFVACVLYVAEHAMNIKKEN